MTQYIDPFSRIFIRETFTHKPGGVLFAGGETSLNILDWESVDSDSEFFRITSKKLKLLFYELDISDLIPIPDGSREIAAVVCAQAGVQYLDLLNKVTGTIELQLQTALGDFDPDRIWLFDDVFTTGSSAIRAQSALGGVPVGLVTIFNRADIGVSEHFARDTGMKHVSLAEGFVPLAARTMQEIPGYEL